MPINRTTRNKDYGDYVLWAWTADVEQQPVQAETELLHHSRSTRLTIYSEYHEKMICNKSNKPTFHSKKLRHFLKICHTYIVANYVFEVQ